MDAHLTSLAENGPLTTALLADTLLEQTWLATAPETWFASPAILVFTCAFALAMKRGGRPRQAFERLTLAIRSRLDAFATTSMALGELRALAGARAVVVAVAGGSAPMLVFQDPGTRGTHSSAAYPVGADQRSTYFFGPASAAGAIDGISTFDESGTHVPPRFREAHPFTRFSCFAFHAGDWDGRLFLLDPASDGAASSVRREFARLLALLVPATARVCSLHAQRHRAEARERARLGRELHDGIIQELTCLDIELELVNARAAHDSGIRDRIARIQERLRAELCNLRKLMQDARYRDIDASRLPAMLEGMVERFGRDAHVNAEYVSKVSDVCLPPPVCGEIVRILQEALVNVRRHSGARHVVVTFCCDNTDWKLSIQDDGRGFSTPTRRTAAGRHSRARPLPGRHGARGRTRRLGRANRDPRA
jgi:signal transduction histidine kinase